MAFLKILRQKLWKCCQFLQIFWPRLQAQFVVLSQVELVSGGGFKGKLKRGIFPPLHWSLTYFVMNEDGLFFAGTRTEYFTFVWKMTIVSYLGVKIFLCRWFLKFDGVSEMCYRHLPQPWTMEPTEGPDCRHWWRHKESLMIPLVLRCLFDKFTRVQVCTQFCKKSLIVF